MKLHKIAPVLLLSMAVLLGSCKKEDPDPVNSSGTNNTAALNFTSLKATDYNIPVGGSTNVTADATGNNLTYSWSASAGDIFGSGSQVTYGAASCCAGANKITCTVSDGNSSETKQITINVQ